MQKHLFIMDRLEKLNLKLDSSLKLGLELCALGVDIYATDCAGIFWNSTDKRVRANVRRISFSSQQIESVSHGDEAGVWLDEFAVIHMRKDPPVDTAYLMVTWALDSVAGKTRVFNHPAALRGLNEKVAIMQFPEACKKSLIATKVDDLVAFIREQCGGDAVLKPLTLYGGRGVIRLQWHEIGEAGVREAIQLATHEGALPHIVQPFDIQIFKGEVRAFAVGGKACAWCNKVPKAGNFLANTGQGATLEPYTPSPFLRDRVNKVAADLYERGVAFVGFDIIGNEITEINITSPRLLQAPSDTTNYYRAIAEWVLHDGKVLLK